MTTPWDQLNIFCVNAASFQERIYYGETILPLTFILRIYSNLKKKANPAMVPILRDWLRIRISQQIHIFTLIFGLASEEAAGSAVKKK